MAPPAGQSVARLVVGVPLYALTVLPPSDTGADDGRGEDIRVVVGGGGGAARTGVANRIVCFFFFWCQGGGVGESLFLAPCCHGHALTGRTPRLFPVAPLDVFPHRAGAQEVHAYSPVDSGKCKATPHPPDDDGGASRFALCGAMPLADAPLAVAAPTVVAAPGGAAPAPADVRVLAAVGAQLSELIFDEQSASPLGGGSAAARLLAVGTSSGTITLLALPSLRTLASSATLHTAPLASLDVSPTRGVSASRDGAVVVWGVRGLAPLARLTLPPAASGVARPPPPAARPGRRRRRAPPPARVSAVRFHPSSADTLATTHAGASGTAYVCLWVAAGGGRRRPGEEALTYTVVTTVALLASPVSALAFSPTGGRLLLGASADGHVAVAAVVGGDAGAPVSLTRRWSTERRRATPPHLLPVTAAAFSRDGEWAFTASADGTVRVWEAGAVAGVSAVAAGALVAAAVATVGVGVAARSGGGCACRGGWSAVVWGGGSCGWPPRRRRAAQCGCNAHSWPSGVGCLPSAAGWRRRRHWWGRRGGRFGTGSRGDPQLLEAPGRATRSWYGGRGSFYRRWFVQHCALRRGCVSLRAPSPLMAGRGVCPASAAGGFFRQVRRVGGGKLHRGSGTVKQA
ncbi:hypothetical protein BU14_0414s0001 [Porphyra umbilicalis]|uniref:Uncharacterized protein n=1 Tax=Porphyra umbilicalis TaxID=2786 RepID=A0A1X6NVZ7_PORUM|nr:hypothetical protein BU14_0414s0001 [Porphyra umbilicalis]|eukprot:OSX72676.1 hypothetical protein BU14_0414s0001 [Porphyra umbilicalis]